MNFRRNKFRILLPLLYVVAMALPVVGLIITIAEGPNPFGFLLPLSAPGFYLLDVLDRFLPDAGINAWFLILLGSLVNLVLYFPAGYLRDYAFNHRQKQR